MARWKMYRDAQKKTDQLLHDINKEERDESPRKVRVTDSRTITSTTTTHMKHAPTNASEKMDTQEGSPVQSKGEGAMMQSSAEFAHNSCIGKDSGSLEQVAYIDGELSSNIPGASVRGMESSNAEAVSQLTCSSYDAQQRHSSQ